MAAAASAKSYPELVAEIRVLMAPYQEQAARSGWNQNGITKEMLRFNHVDLRNAKTTVMTITTNMALAAKYNELLWKVMAPNSRNAFDPKANVGGHLKDLLISGFTSTAIVLSEPLAERIISMAEHWTTMCRFKDASDFKEYQEQIHELADLAEQRLSKQEEDDTNCEDIGSVPPLPSESRRFKEWIKPTTDGGFYVDLLLPILSTELTLKMILSMFLGNAVVRDIEDEFNSDYEILDCGIRMRPATDKPSEPDMNRGPDLEEQKNPDCVCFTS